ncbi:MAG TPA: NAD(P)-binding domain-containing protein, partial [Candidatus Sericytochromatia bacterium]
MVKVAFLGTGLMGEPMVQRLLAAQVPVVAYNRTASKLEALRISGAEIAELPEKAIAQSDCVILMLTNADAVQELLLSEASKQQLSGRTVIQMSTIS